MRLENKVILITGASRGIGAACALACAREGAEVALAAKTIEPHPKLQGTLGDVAAGIQIATGKEALVVQCDVRFEEQVEAMVAKTVERFGRLDALVNNAGAIWFAPTADWSSKKYDLVMGINVRAAFLASRAAIPHLRKQGGHVLMMSPPFDTKAATGKAPYLTSKLGMTILAQAIDAEEERVAAHALWPVTMIKTAATENFGMGSDEDYRTPDVLADATVALLARDPSSSTFRAWLDEEVLREDGVTDLSTYNVVPGSQPGPASIRLIVPDWQPS